MPELSTAPADSAVTGADKLLTIGFESITVQQVADASESKSADVASATTTDLSTATTAYVHVTGTTTITSLGTMQAGAERVVVFDGALLLTHNATSLILPTGANITTAAGDAALFRSEGSGNWRCVFYQRKSGAPLAGASGGGGTPPIVTESTTALTADASNAGNYTRFTNAGAKTYTFDDAETYTAGDEYHGRNVGAADLTIAEAGGMTINPPAGGTLVIPQGGTFTVKIVGADEADLFGVTVAL